MKNITATGLLLGGLLVLGTGSAAAADQGPIAVEVVAPLTGASSPGGYGEEIKEAALAWQNVTNDDAGILGRKVAITVEDDAGSPVQARAVAELVADRHPTVVVGDGLSTTTLPAAEVYKEAGVLLMAFANADGLTARPSPYVFRIIPRNSDYAPCLAAEIARKAAAVPGPVAVLHDGSAYGKGMAEDTVAALPAAVRARVLPPQQVDPQDKDFMAVITRMRAAGARIVMVSTNVTEAGLFIRQASDNGYHPDYFGHSILTSTVLPVMAGADAENIAIEALRGGDFEKSRNDPAVQRLTAAFRAHGQDLTDVGLVISSALDIVQQAIEATGSTDPLVLSRAMHRMSFATPLGKVAYAASGDIADPAIVTYRWVAAGTGYRLKQVDACTP